MSKASIVSINISKGGIPKLPVPSIPLTMDGLQGDGHNHEKHRASFQAVCLQDIEKLEDSIYSKFDSVYDAFIEIGRNGIESIKELKIPKKTASVIEEICSKIKLPSVEIRGIMEITNNKSDGVEIIKKALLDATKKDPTIDITYLGAPKYRLSITAEDFKSAEKTLKPIIVEIQENIEKKKGSFKFTREESKKTREN